MTTGISKATSTGYCGGVSCAEVVARALALVADKWSVPVLEALAFAPGPARFRELQRRIGAITQKELSRQLTRFVHHGVVRRDSDPLHLMRVSYRLTERGRGLLTQLDRMGQWVQS